jgi:hypothetical protein
MSVASLMVYLDFWLTFLAFAAAAAFGELAC